MKKKLTFIILCCLPLLAWAQNINFADPSVEALCVGNWDTNGDGKLSKAEAAAVTDLGEVFRENKEITSFDELQYFTGLTSIGEHTFADCSNLSSIKIPINVTSLCAYAFEECRKLTTVTIPKSVNSLHIPFYGCHGLKSIIVEWTSPAGVNIVDGAGIVASVFPITLFVPIGSKNAYEAAEFWKDFASIEEPKNITFADDKVKAICVQNWDTNNDGELSNAEAAAVTDLGKVFQYNEEITSFDELQHFTGLTKLTGAIVEWAGQFSGCTNLKSIIIPKSVAQLSFLDFDSAIEHIKVDPDNQFFDSRDDCDAIIERESNALVVGCISTIIPETVTEIKDFAFSGKLWGRSTIVIPSSVKSIGEDAFSYCGSLETVKLPSSITSISDYAFSCCGNLRQVFIPSSVASIGYGVFNDCQSLTSVTLQWNEPISIPESPFLPTKPSLENATLYVPAGTKDAYQNAEVWKDFGEIVELGNDMADIGENVYYLKNVETGKYLSNGNAWGMHAVLADREEALPVRIHKREGNYMLYCPERSQFLQYIFRADETNVFVDYNGQDDASPYWTFITQGKDIYYIQTEPGHPVYGQEAMPGTCLGNNPDDGTDVNGNVGMGEHRNNVLWQLELARKTGEQHNRLEELANRLEPLGVDVEWAREILKWDEADYFDAMREITRLEKELGRIDQLKGELRNMIASASKIGVDTDGASSVADNDATIEEIRQAISDLRSAFIAKLGEGIDENLLPFDVTGVIVNPSFTYDNAEGWEGDEPGFQPEHYCHDAEFYGRSFDFHQTISGLPNGEYRLEVKRFRRDVDDEHVHYYANDALCNVSDVYEEAQDRLLSYDVTDNSYSDFLEYEVDGTIKYVPNSMTGARVAFDAGLYGSWLPFEVTDGTATIGIKVDTEEGERWVCFDDFRLTYCGDEPAHLFAESDISTMDDAIYVEPFTAHIGMDVDIEVKLKNAQTASSYSFNLVLPEGITIADDGNGGFKGAITLSPRNGKHTVLTNKIADNIYRIGVTSTSGKSLTGSDGTVLTIKAHVQDDMPGGDLYRIIVRSPQIVYSNDTKPEVQKTITRVNVIDYDKGDANGDGDVDLADVQVVIKHCVGKPVAKFIEWKADVDEDGMIDLADAIRILNYHMGKIPALSREAEEASSRALRESARNGLTVADFGLSPKGGNINVSLALDAANVYTGYQFKVETPEGLSYVVDSDDDVECELGEGYADHEAVAHWNEEDKLLNVVVASMSLSPFNGQSLSLQIPLAATTLPLGSSADFKITGVTLIKQGGEKVRLGDAVFKVTIGKKGDVNGDGYLTAADVTALVNYILGRGTLVNEAAAYVNDDEKIDIADVTALIGIVTEP